MSQRIPPHKPSQADFEESQQMRKCLKAITMLTLVSILFAPFIARNCAKGGVFPDPNLEAAIREAIGKPEGDIEQSDLEGLNRLDASDKGINNLTGLEHCTNLTELYLYAS